MQKHTVQMGTGWQSPAIQRHVKTQAKQVAPTRTTVMGQPKQAQTVTLQRTQA